MNILVTGATGGIGKAIADILSGGHIIHATGRNLAVLEKYDKYIACDLKQNDDIERLGKYIIDNKIDVLVNNAGSYIYSESKKLNKEIIDNMIDVNLKAPLYLISKAIPHMQEQKWGRIINIGSISGVMGEAGASVYSASKAGLIGATKALALELAEYGITVNTINPGWVDTDMGNSSSEAGDWTKEEIIECIPQKRFVSPYEVAAMVKYLVSDDAKGVTGQSVNLCAGLSVGC